MESRHLMCMSLHAASLMQDSIREIFQRKGDAIVELNLKALAAGKEIAEKLM